MQKVLRRLCKGYVTIRINQNGKTKAKEGLAHRPTISEKNAVSQSPWEHEGRGKVLYTTDMGKEEDYVFCVRLKERLNLISSIYHQLRSWS